MFYNMNEKLANYLNGVFAPYDGVKSVTELKTDLLSDLQDRFRELKDEGKDDETAFEMTIDSIGDIEQTVQEVANLSRSLEWKVFTNFSASNLPKSDFAGVKVHEGKFEASDLHGSDFSGADLTGSSFTVSDLRESNFDRANLTDCNLSTNDLTRTSYNKTILVRTKINMSALTGAKFTDVKLIDCKLSMTDLSKALFENCTFNGVEFKYCDLSGVSLDGQALNNVKFDKTALNNASFKDTTIRNVSFLSPIIFSKKYYRAIKTICFDGATMDKLTYAALKGLEANLSQVTVI